ncbi:SH3 domain-containing kinase-binding protein 1-like isoform X3 [Ornithodoros turicata]|uniref:SH3 domain-containing kinase-binding protein 1-like isoform X3 n=1 Tax=Ornithodoros turicata TaxID=34597 RepID=UPI0031389291
MTENRFILGVYYSGARYCGVMKGTTFVRRLAQGLVSVLTSQSVPEDNEYCTIQDLKQRRARVAYSYQPQNDDELHLEVSDVIEVLEEVEEGWWKGVLKGRIGVFPSNFVVLENAPPPSSSPRVGHWTGGVQEDGLNRKTSQDFAAPEKVESSTDVNETKARPGLKGIGFGNILPESRIKGKGPTGIDSPNDKRQIALPSKKPPPPVPPDATLEAPKLPPKPVREQAKVLYTYEAQNDDELTIKEGDVITIITKEVEDKGWWKGELGGRIGVFPDNFVKLIKDEVPAKPDRPDRPMAGKVVPKPDLPDKPAFPEYGSNADRPISKVPPFKSADVAKKASSSTQTVEEKKESKRLAPKKTTPPPPPVGPTPKKQRPRVPSAVDDVPPSPPPAPPPQVTEAIDVVPSAPPLEEGAKAPLSNGVTKAPRAEPAETSIAETFDSIEPSENRLSHPTANRVKPPMNRRPPSHIAVVKENGNEPSENQPAWMKELGRRNQAKFTGQPEPKGGSSPEAESRAPLQKSPPLYRPAIAQAKEEGAANSTPSRSPLTKDAPVTSSSPQRGGAKPQLDSEIIQELCNEIKTLKETTVSKDDYKDLLQQMATLKETVEANRMQYSKLVRDLIAEVDEEKKLRMTLQVEIDRLKKLTLTV